MKSFIQKSLVILGTILATVAPRGEAIACADESLSELDQQNCGDFGSASVLELLKANGTMIEVEHPQVGGSECDLGTGGIGGR